MASPARENASSRSHGMRRRPRSYCQEVVHSLKVGFALIVVSLFFFLRRLYDIFGDNALWAVVSVLVVMQVSVGSTLRKGVDRTLATLFGGFLGVVLQRLSTLFGGKEKPIVAALSLFIIGAVIRFTRFVPQVKKRVDYGLNIFIIMFSLAFLSIYRDAHIRDLVLRLSSIIIGSLIAILSIFLSPFWSGDELRNLLATNLERLGNFFERFGTDDDYHLQPGGIKRSFAKKYGSVFTSKTREKTLAKWARWEPRHGQIRYHHPWQKYLELGNLTRKCAYKAEALDHVCLRCLIQISNELGINIKKSCQSASLECGKALKMISKSVKSMTCSPNETKACIAKAKGSIESIHCLLRWQPYNWEGLDDEVMKITVPAATVTSLLSGIVNCIERIIEAVDELSSLAH